MTPKNKNLSTELVIKSTDKSKEKNPLQFIDKNKSLISKIGVYSANMFGEVLSKYYELTPAIGNGYGAIGFATLDVLSGDKNSKFQRLAKTAGYVWYIGECVYDLVSVLNGEYNSLSNFPLDVAMAWHLGAESRKLYKEAGKKEDDKEHSVEKDLEEVLKNFNFKSKKDPAKAQSLEEKTSDGKNYFQEIKEYFGDKIETFKENYQIRTEKSKERKRIEKEEKAKASLLSNKDVSLKKKKQFLDYYGENPDFMKKYEIENKYFELKKKPIDEQMQFMENKKNSLGKSLAQIKRASWIKRFSNSVYISEIKSELKEVKEILWELDIEKKNLPQRPIDKFL